MITPWDALYLAATPVVAPVIATRRVLHGKYQKSLPAMLGRRYPAPLPPPSAERLWLHSVSVGETVAAGAVYTRLRDARPDWETIHTTTTETGQEQSAHSLPDVTARQFAPLDFSPIVERFLRVYQPTAYLFFETELWPNTLTACHQRGLPVFLVNGKISDRSARRYAAVKGLFQPFLKPIALALMQTEEDAERFQSIAGRRVPTAVIGNVKFDSLPAELSPEERTSERTALGVGPSEILLIAGSTHRGEEEIVVAAYQTLKAAYPSLRLLLVPRHPERFNEVEQLLRSRGLAVSRLSQEAPRAQESVLLGDVMGRLGRLFGLGEIALVGGSWVPIGGHNLLEPAAHRVPVLHGPHMHAQKEIMRIMTRHRASQSVAATALTMTLDGLLREPDRRSALGQAGYDAASANRGAAQRAADLILDQLSLRAS